MKDEEKNGERKERSTKKGVRGTPKLPTTVSDRQKIIEGLNGVKNDLETKHKGGKNSKKKDAGPKPCKEVSGRSPLSM